MIVGIQNEILKIQSLGLLKRLLEDKTTRANIIWATDAYKDRGRQYERDQEIKIELVTGANSDVIKNRARKEMEHQAERTRQHAEVFTPLWICKMMNECTDDGWFPENNLHPFERNDKIEFLESKTWQKYVDSRLLEITCGEAPYLVSRYDVSNGESIPVADRIGILDRKLRVVNENTETEEEWIEWTTRAFQATYGYEFQGDNVLIARVNLLMTFEEYMEDRWKRKPNTKEYQSIANIISWNIWQMDGLTETIPYCKAEDESHQMTLFEFLNMETDEDKDINEQPLCEIYNWRSGYRFKFSAMKERSAGTMKFDFIIGNPPYQDETTTNNRAGALYPFFYDAAKELSDTFVTTKEPDKMEQQVKQLVDTVKETIKQKVVAPAMESFDLKKGTQNKVERQVEREIDQKFEALQKDYLQQTKVAETEFERLRNEASSEHMVREAESAYKASIDDAMKAFVKSAQKTVQETIEEKPKELVERLEKRKEEEEKHTIEDDIRSHLRGFARTIPSFIMAYGDGNLTLANFDDYTEDDVFLEVTGITEEEFRFLRDGGDYTNPETGEQEHFNGHLFNEVVFDDSINEFWNKKTELANYFDESQEEDIFDYIPPQKTNQIFTPRWVVNKMVEELEEKNPGCFDDSTKTFADLYMKSGLYITEIVKRLFRSEKIKAEYPDDQERIKHILREQVYGMAPTRIIYLIATNYILGFDESLKNETKNFVQVDAAEAAKDGTLEELVEKYFG